MDCETESHSGDVQSSSLTTEKELWGWYSYQIAAEVFAVCGVGSFLPVTLEQLGKSNGVLKSDGFTSCIQPSAPPQHMKRDGDVCVIRLFGSQISTSSFALYSFSLAVFVQTLLLISIGAIADYGDNRKQLLLAFGFIGSIACMLFIIVVPKIYLLAVLLTVTSVACLGASFVLLNSFLPLLAANHPSDSSDIPLEANASSNDSIEAEGLLDQDRSFKYAESGNASPALKLSNKISAYAIGLGYAAAALVQVLGIAIIITYKKILAYSSASTLPMRSVLFLVGLWWAIFTLPTVFWLKRRPGPPLMFKARSQTGCLSWLRYVIFAWISLWKTVKIAAQLRQVVIFLVAWFILSDGIATVSGTAILFARTELKMSSEAVAGLSITATASGIVGAACWPIIGRRFKLSAMGVVICCVCLYEIIPLYGLAGFLPFVKKWGVGGLQQPWEIFPLACCLGFVMGGISSYCRSVYGLLIPPGMEAAFYALYAVTDKGSSIIGPALVGRIIDATGSIRMGFWFLAILMIAPAPIFWLVNLEKGVEDANRYVKKQMRNN